MKYLILILLLLAGCTSQLDSRNLKAGAFLCHDQGGIARIEIDPLGTDLYICRDGAQFVVNSNNPNNDENRVHRVTYCEDEEKNKILTEILNKERKE